MNGKILVVDDDAAHLHMLRTILKSQGHAVESATDGEVRHPHGQRQLLATLF